MSPRSFVKSLVLLAVLGYLAVPEVEARSLEDEQRELQQELINKNINIEDLNEMARFMSQQGLFKPTTAGQMATDENDDDDDDDDKSNLQVQSQLAGSASNLFNADKPLMADQSRQEASAPSSGAKDLKTAASHHHHGHHVKGWLDMGAWTGKKGAFGWHDKHPVGGKGRK